MERRSVEAIVRALNRARVRYLIAGGLAVIAHGYVRFTGDVDLILDLRDANLRRGLRALKELGYRPRAPVALEEFADARKRSQWVREKGMKVFTLVSARHSMTEVDLCAEMPVVFTRAWGRRARREMGPGLSATFVGFEDLLRMKVRAGRPQDRADVRELTCVRGKRK